MPLQVHMTALCIVVLVAHGAAKDLIISRRSEKVPEAKDIDGFIRLPGIWFSDVGSCSNFANYLDYDSNQPNLASMIMLCDQDPRCQAFVAGWMKDYAGCPKPADAASAPMPDTYLSTTRCNATHTGNIVDASCGNSKHTYLACEGLSINPPNGNEAIASYTLPPGVPVGPACKQACDYANCTAMSLQGSTCWLYRYSRTPSPDMIGYIQLPPDSHALQV